MDSIQLFSDYEFLDILPEGFAQAAKNDPHRTWIKFTFTDDQPNGNNMRIPKTEFASLIRTGEHMPIKMEKGNPKGDHKGSTPIGAIAKLKEEDNKVIGIAALWPDEDPESINALKEAYAGGEKRDLSWEVSYDEAASYVDENGIHNLMGTATRGSVFVGNPAYQGRTQLLALAQQEDKTQEENKLTDTTTVDVAALQAELADVKVQLEAANTALQSKETELETVISPELASLREFKQAAEAKDAKYNKLTERRKKLKEAGVDYSEEDFETKKEMLAEMDEAVFEFLVQERVAFSSTDKKTTSASAEITNPAIPDLTNANTDSPSELVRKALLSK
jgi:hypothetical protein